MLAVPVMSLLIIRACVAMRYVISVSITFGVSFCIELNQYCCKIV